LYHKTIFAGRARSQKSGRPRKNKPKQKKTKKPNENKGGRAPLPVGWSPLGPRLDATARPWFCVQLRWLASMALFDGFQGTLTASEYVLRFPQLHTCAVTAAATHLVPSAGTTTRYGPIAAWYQLVRQFDAGRLAERCRFSPAFYFCHPVYTLRNWRASPGPADDHLGLCPHNPAMVALPPIISPLVVRACTSSHTQAPRSSVRLWGQEEVSID